MFNPDEKEKMHKFLEDIFRQLIGPNAEEHGDSWRYQDLMGMLDHLSGEVSQVRAYLKARLDGKKVKQEEILDKAGDAIGWWVLFILRVGKGKE